MTRTIKFTKLANAIRSYRGSYNPTTGKWFYAPKTADRERVILWLARLGLDTAAEMQRIDWFKTFPEFETWLKELK